MNRKQMARYYKVREQRLAHRRNNRDKELAWHKEWVRKNPEAAKLNHSRKWHKRRALKNAAIVESELAKVAARIKEIKSSDMLPCHWCGAETVKWKRHVDHIIPISRGGKHVAENLCCACPHCNCSKSDLLPDEFISRRLKRSGQRRAKRLAQGSNTQHC